MSRLEGRNNSTLRKTKIQPGVQEFAEGSALIQTGKTSVLCTATIENGVPRFLRNSGQGWLTAEYSMLPRSTSTRTPRESKLGKIQGRTSEIQRLIGRSLRQIIDLTIIGEKTITLDCDVIQADGGTRTASITGAYVALYEAIFKQIKSKTLVQNPLKNAIAATSVGIINHEIIVDLNYQEDSNADVDFNIVMNDNFEFVEIQGTAEKAAFSKSELDTMLEKSSEVINQLFIIQKDAINQIQN
ncbi:MAG: ribonuclease PH [SAR202 cluster bacterium]|nr:ribonuclease PH [SAR202 cluster bacterium]